MWIKGEWLFCCWGVRDDDDDDDDDCWGYVVGVVEGLELWYADK